MFENTTKTTAKEPVMRTNFKHYADTQRQIDYLCSITGQNQSKVIRRAIAYAAIQVWDMMEDSTNDMGNSTRCL